MDIDKEKELKELEEKCISSEKVFDGVLLHITKDTVLLPNGETSIREVNHHIGAVCIVPLTEDGQLIVERQYRYALNSVITEIPAGKLDSADEDPLAAAKRELSEETGYTADSWESWGFYNSVGAYSDEKVYIFLAHGLHKGARHLDDDEFLNVFSVPVSELLTQVLSGEIIDPKTQIAVLRCARLLGL